VSANPDPRMEFERGPEPRDRDPASRPWNVQGVPEGTARILTWVSFALAVIALMAGWMPALIGLVLGLVADNMGDRLLGRWAAIANGAAIVLLVLLSFAD
jgi:hypothetical protein